MKLRQATLALVLGLGFALGRMSTGAMERPVAAGGKVDDPATLREMLIALSKPATVATRKANSQFREKLPFQDTKDFEEARRGLIAPLDATLIEGTKGYPIWNLKSYDFIKPDSEAPDTVNPSLWRQAQLLTIHGLFKVTDRVYQVRGQDLANISFIETEKGLIVIDPLMCTETARAALDLYHKHRPKKPVIAVIYTHSHIDHYGGIRGVVREEDVHAGKVAIIAPHGFMDYAISENVIAGNVMSRRAGYMYGAMLPRGAAGQVTAGLGLNISLGHVGIIAPTDIITKTGEERTIDGVRIVFQFTPGTEAPAEMNFYFPEFKALCMAENLSRNLHNLLTLRGAPVRDPLAWSMYLNEALDRFGNKTDVVFTSHQWPKWGNLEVRSFIKKQRDLYKYLHDQSLRLMNQGYTMVEVAEMVELPDSLGREWFNRSYYGSVNHNVKAIYQKYLGWFTGVPAQLHPLPPVEGGKKYVEFMGGAEALMAKAQKSFAAGEYRWVAEVVNHLVFAEPDNKAARELLADAYEQLGYQSENAPWRNFYLTGAQELRRGIIKFSGSSASPDTIRAMPLELFFDFLAVHVDGPKAAGKLITLNFVFTDTKQQYVISVENSVMHHFDGKLNKNADATVRLTRTALDRIVLKETTIVQAIQSGEIKVEGNVAKVGEWHGLLDNFNLWFNIVTPKETQTTKRP